jgi:hypothetical protein
MSDGAAANAAEVFLEEFPKLDDRARRTFTECIQQLQLKSYVLRGGALKVDPRYAFLDRNEELVSAYLTLGGWRLSLDRTLGVARLFHPEGSGKVRFNKNETLLLLCLRLVYHQGRQSVSESPDVRVTVGGIREKLHELLPAAAVKPFLSRKLMGTALRSFQRAGITEFSGSAFVIADDTEVVIQPVIELLISAQGLEATQQALEELNAGIVPSEEAIPELTEGGNA